MPNEIVLDRDDLRLIAALQDDGRLTTEHAARVLGINPRVVRRRLRALFGAGLHVVAVRPRDEAPGVMLLRIRVLRGKLAALTAALAARDDIPFIDVSASGDEIGAILVGDAGQRNRLVFRQLPATSAVVSVDAHTVMHVFSDATEWRLGVLTEDERRQLQPQADRPADQEPDDLDSGILGLLEDDARLPASAIAAQLGHPESTVRRRLATLREERRFVTQAFIDPARLGLAIDASLMMEVPPARLDEAGRSLAKHPAVHGALATTGTFNLHAAVWLRDLEHLYEFITQDIAGLGATRVETILVGHAVKRPGKQDTAEPGRSGPPGHARPRPASGSSAPRPRPAAARHPAPHSPPEQVNVLTGKPHPKRNEAPKGTKH